MHLIDVVRQIGWDDVRCLPLIGGIGSSRDVMVVRDLG